MEKRLLIKIMLPKGTNATPPPELAFSGPNFSISKFGGYAVSKAEIGVLLKPWVNWWQWRHVHLLPSAPSSKCTCCSSLVSATPLKAEIWLFFKVTWPSGSRLTSRCRSVSLVLSLSRCTKCFDSDPSWSRDKIFCKKSHENLVMTSLASWKDYFLDFTQRVFLAVKTWIFSSLP